MKALLDAKDLKGEKATTSPWVVLSGDIDRNRVCCGAKAKLFLERWKDFWALIQSLLDSSKTFSGKELFINGVLSPEFAKLLAGPILHALAEVPEDVACLYSKDLETDVLSVCEKAIAERLP